jgi:hypothetical protein
MTTKKKQGWSTETKTELSSVFSQLLFGAALIISLSAIGQGQYENIKVSGDERTPCEPSIAINPLNPDKMVAGAVLSFVYYSHDGGRTWTGDKLKSPYGVWGDPVILADYEGNFYYFHLSDPTGRNWSSEEILDRIVCQKSTDGGITWSDGSYMGFAHPKDQDKEWAAVDPISNQIYVTWTQFDKYGSSNFPEDQSNILFSTSTDGGENWSEAISINQFPGNCLDKDSTTEGAVPSVGPNGEVYVAWSFDEKIYFDRSMDKGKTWLKEDKIVANQPGGWTHDIPGLQRCNGMPMTAVDLSEGPNRGRVYVCWADQRNGQDNVDIFLAYSDNHGDSWSKPTRVNTDKGTRHQFLPWMTTDPLTGVVYVVFYDRRNYKDNQTDVYLARSHDGGVSFTNERISESPFEPNRSKFFGDYNHISAYGGRVRPIWTRMHNGQLSIMTAIIEDKPEKK